MYQERREEVILCILNTVRSSSYVSGTQGGVLTYQERSEVSLCIRNKGKRSSYIYGTQ